MRLFRRKKETKKQSTRETRECKLCRQVRTAGRSGEKIIKFVDGEAVKVEIINESHIPGRMCYALYLEDDAELGAVSVPIRYCPACGSALRRKS